MFFSFTDEVADEVQLEDEVNSAQQVKSEQNKETVTRTIRKAFSIQIKYDSIPH